MGGGRWEVQRGVLAQLRMRHGENTLAYRHCVTDQLSSTIPTRYGLDGVWLEVTTEDRWAGLPTSSSSVIGLSTSSTWSGSPLAVV